jgi:hypothetical protein
MKLKNHIGIGDIEASQAKAMGFPVVQSEH